MPKAPPGGNAAPTPNAAPAKTPTAPAKTTAPPPKKRGWGEPARPEDWLKLRNLVGVRFVLARVSEATITPKSGENAGVARPSYVFELDDGRCFSVNKTDSIGKQVASFGVPPTPAAYTIAAVPSDKSSTGDALLLRPWHPTGEAEDDEEKPAGEAAPSA